MAIIRGFEPYYFFLIRQQFWEAFGFVLDEPQEGIKAEILSSFLASSLNIELVYIILEGITHFSSNQQ